MYTLYCCTYGYEVTTSKLKYVLKNFIEIMKYDKNNLCLFSNIREHIFRIV